MIKLNELRKKSKTELQEELNELRREQFNLRMQTSSTHHQKGNVRSHQFKVIRRQIARINTLLTAIDTEDTSHG